LPADLFQRRASTQPTASGNFSPRIAYPQSDTVSANPRSGLHQWRRRAAKRGRAHGPAQPRRKPERRYPSVGRRVETRESERNSSPGSDATYGRSRRKAVVADRCLGRLSWAEIDRWPNGGTGTGWRPHRAARKGLVSALRQTLILITQLTRPERNLVPDDAAQSSGPSFFMSSPFRVDCRMPRHTVLTFSGASFPSSGRRWKTRV
jgi:hypothetical protein